MYTMKTQEPRMFTFFPELPSELRHKIWLHACSPRTLTLTYSNDYFHSPSPVPPLLSTTHESRQEALRIYTLSFGTKKSPARTYFNPYLDTLYLPRHREMGYDETLRDFRELVHDPERVLDQVRCVAIDHVNADFKRPWEAYNKAVLLRGFKYLEQVMLILNEDGSGVGDFIGEENSGKGVDFLEPKVDPERMLRIWYCFRQGFMMEEKMLEEVCTESGKEYRQYTLPTVKIRIKVTRDAKARQQDGRGNTLAKMITAV